MIEELISEAHGSGREPLAEHSDGATLGAMLGFAVMMTLDVALG